MKKILIDYELDSEMYRVYYSQINKIAITRDVIICENDFNVTRTSISKAVRERLIEEKLIRGSVVIDNDDDDVDIPPFFSRANEQQVTENLHEL